MSRDNTDENLLKQRFAASVPDFENGDRVRHPFATRRLVVIFRRGTEAAAIGDVFQQIGIHSFKQERNGLTYVVEQPPGANRVQLFKKISRCKEVRYVGPHRNRDG